MLSISCRGMRGIWGLECSTSGLAQALGACILMGTYGLTTKLENQGAKDMGTQGLRERERREL